MDSRTESEWSMSAESSPKIVIVDESPIRAAILEEGLREAGFTSVVHISEMQSLLARIYACTTPTSSSSTWKTPAATCWNKCSR
jgi:rhodanese-related sulfurtransferase